MILLDTHALVWWISDPKRIPAKGSRLINAAVRGGEPIAVSSISIWEIAMLVARGRLALTMDAAAWIDKGSRNPKPSSVARPRCRLSSSSAEAAS